MRRAIQSTCCKPSLWQRALLTLAAAALATFVCGANVRGDDAKTPVEQKKPVGTGTIRYTGTTIITPAAKSAAPPTANQPAKTADGKKETKEKPVSAPDQL